MDLVKPLIKKIEELKKLLDSIDEDIEEYEEYSKDIYRYMKSQGCNNDKASRYLRCAYIDMEEIREQKEPIIKQIEYLEGLIKYRLNI